MATRRRSFLKSLAAAPLLPRALVSTQAAPSPSPSPPPPPAAMPAPSPSPSPVPGPVAEALGQVVQLRHGPQLEPGDLDEIKKNIEDNLQAADKLKKALKLTNADEPVSLFQAVAPVPGRR
jgi:hypothetical protein